MLYGRKQIKPDESCIGIKELRNMQQEVDEINKIIHIICTEEERKKILKETPSYALYDYQFNFIIKEEGQ